MRAKRLIVATRNLGKLREMDGVLGDTGLALETLEAHPEVGEIEETGASFEANARLKASTVARATGEWALAEDSGLVVESLGGAPGVHSARYAGGHGDDAANNAKLAAELEGVEARRAHYACVIALARPDGEIVATTHGRCEGEIARAPRGEGGFGYDPWFIPDALPHRTMAELTPDQKHDISHRGQALRALGPLLRLHLEG